MNAHARRWLAAAAVAATALTLAACDSDVEDPPPTTESSTEPTTEPSEDVTTEDPTPTATPPEVEEPEVPEEMLVDDVDGAAAASWYFLKLYDYMRATGDTTLWDSMTASECGWCEEVRTETVSTYQDGSRIESPGLDFDITEAGVRLPSEEADHYTVLLAVTEPAGTFVASDGATAEIPPQTLDPFGIALRYANGRFLVVAVDYELA